MTHTFIHTIYNNSLFFLIWSVYYFPLTICKWQMKWFPTWFSFYSNRYKRLPFSGALCERGTAPRVNVTYFFLLLFSSSVFTRHSYSMVSLQYICKLDGVLGRLANGRAEPKCSVSRHGSSVRYLPYQEHMNTNMCSTLTFNCRWTYLHTGVSNKKLFFAPCSIRKTIGL